MIWGKKHEDKYDPFEPHEWFAWRPVQLMDGRWIWWERIMRHKYLGRDSTGVEYYLIDQDKEEL